MEYLILYIKIKCMHKGILVKCNNPTKSPQISSFCEERKKSSTLCLHPLPHSQNHGNKHKKTLPPSSPLPPPTWKQTHPQCFSLFLLKENIFFY